MWTPIREIIASRELLLALAQRDLKIRYKQTLIGTAWALLMPLLLMGVFTAVFARMARVETGAIPYPVFVFCGLLPWQFFASSLKGAAESLTRNSRLIAKIHFPREVFPLAQILAAAVDFLIGSLILVVLMAWYTLPIRPTIAWLPVLFAVQILFTGALALLVSLGNLFFRDVKYLLDFALLPWMLATSVVYPISRELGVWSTLLRLNPMTPIIDAYRQVLLQGQAPDLPGLAGATLFAGLLAGLALLVFHETEPWFAEVL